MNFIELSHVDGYTLFVNVAHIKTFNTAKNNHNMTSVYYGIGSDIVLETEEEIIKLIKQSVNTIVAQVEKIC